MKRLYILLLFSAQLSCLLSCYKDEGNYDYKDINKISFSGIDPNATVPVFIGDTLSITPVVNSSMPNGNNYSYEWSLFREGVGEKIVSGEKNLKIRINELPGTYTVQYRVTDNGTGVLFHTNTTLLVRTNVYEGYMVLSNVEGKSRLDMLSYDGIAGTFTQFTDVLAKMGSSLPEQGAPLKVVCTRVTNAFSYSDSTFGIYLLTATGTNRLHPETFDWRPTYNIRYEIAGNLSPDFKAQNMIWDSYLYFVPIFLWSDHNFYLRAGGMVPVYNLPVNKYVGKPAFKAAPYATSNGSDNLMMFNEDDNSFALLRSFTNTNVEAPPIASKPGEIDFPVGKELVYMGKSATGFSYAILKDADGTGHHLLKFRAGSLPVYYKPLKGTDIDKATHFALGANPEYIFYSVGGKVYEYDLYLESSKLMLDKGAAEISYLSFEQFSPNRSPATYGVWSRWLTVGVYDPSGKNGTLEQYSVPDANEALVLQKQWTGFGKITSVSYRER